MNNKLMYQVFLIINQQTNCNKNRLNLAQSSPIDKDDFDENAFNKDHMMTSSE